MAKDLDPTKRLKSKRFLGKINNANRKNPQTEAISIINTVFIEEQKEIMENEEFTQIEAQHENVEMEEARKIVEEFKQLEEEIAGKFQIYQFDEINFFNTFKDSHRQLVDFIVIDPPYGCLNVAHDFITNADRNNVVNHAYHLLKPLKFIVIFSAWQNLHEWNQELSKDDHFTVYKSILNIVKKPSNNMAQAGGSNMQNMVEYAIVAYKKCLGEGHVEFDWFGKQHFIQGSFNKGMNVIENYVAPKNKITVNSQILRTEEKSVELLMEIIERFSKFGDLVMDFFSGTGTSAIAALRLGRKWIGSDGDSNVYEIAKERVLVHYKLLKQSNKILKLDPKKPIKKKNIPRDNYPEKLFEDQKNIEYDIGVELKKLGLEIKTSPLCKGVITDSQNWNGLFATKNFKKGDLIAQYYGNILSESTFKAKYKHSKPSRVIQISKQVENQTFYIEDLEISPAAYANCNIDLINKTLLEANAEFQERADILTYEDLSNPDIVELYAVKDINPGEEILVQYIKGKTFEEVNSWFENNFSIRETVHEIQQEEEQEFEEEQEEEEQEIKEGEEEQEEQEEKKNKKFVNANIFEDDLADFLFKNSLSVDDTVFKLLERYEALGLEKNEKTIELIESKLLKYFNFSPKQKQWLNLILHYETNDQIINKERHSFFIEDVVDDTVQFRSFIKDVRDYTRKKFDSYIHDQNFLGSKNRKSYLFKIEKEKDQLKVAHEFDEMMLVAFPEHSFTANNAIWSEKQTMRQGFHTDFNRFGDKYPILSYSVILSLADDNYFWQANLNKGEITMERIYLKFGSVVVFTANCIHAGEGFTPDNFRSHRYFTHPKMLPDPLISQEFRRYDGLTLQLNLLL